MPFKYGNLILYTFLNLLKLKLLTLTDFEKLLIYFYVTHDDDDDDGLFINRKWQKITIERRAKNTKC